MTLTIASGCSIANNDDPFIINCMQYRKMEMRRRKARRGAEGKEG